MRANARTRTHPPARPPAHTRARTHTHPHAEAYQVVAMASFCKRFSYKSELDSLAPLSKLSMVRRSNTRTLAMCLPRMRPAFKIKNVSASPLSFSSCFSVTAGLPKLKTAAVEIKGLSGHGGASASTCSIPVSADTLKWIFTGAAALLMLVKNVAIKKPFLVPLVALLTPQEVITWIRGEYGMWAAFLALLVRLFYYIAGELELPLITLLLIITAPYQALDLRGATGSLVACACVAIYLAYQHFSGAGGLRGSFKEGTFLASIAAICLVAVPLTLLLGGF